MPLYEYECSACEAQFDALRGMSEADDPIVCPRCESDTTRRIISLFAAVGERGVIAGEGSSCASCSPSSSCATCGARGR
ncbi:MAG: FmdB family zinc ribbon protein [Chloroflexota bacterium]